MYHANGYFIASLDSVIVPYPGINERLGLCSVFVANIIVNLIVVAFAVKWRVNIAKVNCFVLDVFPHNFEVIPCQDPISLNT